jgi:predicted transcriptional regulator
MDTGIPNEVSPQPIESDSDRTTRLAWEKACIGEAMADAAAGRTVSLERFNAWVDALGSGHELPLPQSDN